jgi:hypothetical protein
MLTRDGETAVLLPDTVVRLSAIGAAIFDLTEQPVELEELAALLGARFGVPDDSTAQEATARAVADLIQHGVLEQK